MWCYFTIQLPSPAPTCGWDAEQMCPIQDKEEEEKIWKRPHERTEKTRTPLFICQSSPCKIVFLFISDWLFLQDDFLKFCQSLPCVGISSSYPSCSSWIVCCVDVRKNKSRNTLYVVNQLQDIRWTRAAASQIELHHNKLTRLWPTQIRT